jgi:hypothetical protein
MQVKQIHVTQSVELPCLGCGIPTTERFMVNTTSGMAPGDLIPACTADHAIFGLERTSEAKPISDRFGESDKFIPWYEFFTHSPLPPKTDNIGESESVFSPAEPEHLIWCDECQEYHSSDPMAVLDVVSIANGLIHIALYAPDDHTEILTHSFRSVKEIETVLSILKDFLEVRAKVLENTPK